MSTTTPNLGLFKYDITNPADLAAAFNIKTALNNNWDIIDEAISNSGGARNVGEIVASTIPLTDAGLHLLDGSLIQGNGIYSDFVDYIAGLYEADPTASYFAHGEAKFIQPTLSADGTIGGDSFAVYSSYTESGHPAYYLFDNNDSTYYSSYNTSSSNYEIFYNPVPLKVSQITIYYHNSNGINKNMILYASNDNSSWIALTAVSSESGDYKTYTLQNENYYKYYKMEYSSWTAIWNIDITATQQTSPEQEWQTSVSTYGVCGKFVYDSTNNTVRLPKITGFIEGTTDLTALGDLIEAGLPNITGYFQIGDGCCVNDSSGVFSRTTNRGNAKSGNWYDSNTCRGDFDASRSNSIYGNSTTVQPQTIKVLYYIVIATSTKTSIQVDIDEIATDLNGKADTDLSNVPNSKGILTESYVNGTSWYRVYSDGWCEQGGLSDNGSAVAVYTKTITFLKPFRDTNYTAFCTMRDGQGQTNINLASITKASMQIVATPNYGDSYTQRYVYWEAKGYIN